jgi:hypothetical protein
VKSLNDVFNPFSEVRREAAREDKIVKALHTKFEKQMDTEELSLYQYSIESFGGEPDSYKWLEKYGSKYKGTEFEYFVDGQILSKRRKEKQK